MYLIVEVGKSKKTAYTMIVNMLTTIITGLGSLAVTSKILSHLGSDYNGVNSTAAQVISVLGLIEGGFTLAAQVALYGPVSDNNFNKVNKILTYTSRKMRTLGIYTLIFGVTISLIYANFIKSELPYLTVLNIMLLAVGTTAFNIGVVSKYRLMFQVTQTEYTYGIVNIFATVLMLLSVFFALNHTDNVVLIRFIYFIAEIAKGLVIIYLAKRRFKFLSLNCNIEDVTIRGTRDVFVARITGLIYNSAPVFFLSTIVGTSSTSVYAIYLSITNIILSFLNTAINAPMHGIGQLIAESDKTGNRDRITSVFREYELATTFLNCLLSSITVVMLVPFIKLYTANVSDISYSNDFYAIVMVLTTVFQIMHMPSGICMNVSGKFKVIKYTQIVATIVLIISMSIGVWQRGLNGLLFGKLLTAIVLCILEVTYNYLGILKLNLNMFIRIAFSNYFPMICLSAIEYHMVSKYMDISSWLAWIGIALMITVINFNVLIATNILNNKNAFKGILVRAKGIVLSKHN